MAYRIRPLVLKLQNAWSRQSQQSCKFLTSNNTRWTIERVYRLHRFCRARTSEDYRSYDADKKLQQKISNLSEVGLFKEAL